MQQPQNTASATPRISSFGKFVRRASIPNVLTCVRIALIPIFLWLIFTSAGFADGGTALAHRWWALIVFSLLMFTDQLDGFLARKYSVITDFGKLADPIADKALMITALVSLSWLDELWWWVTAVIIIRELGITVWRLFLARRGNVVPASQGGKIKTVLQALAVVLFILPAGGFMGWVASLAMVAAVVQTVVTGVQYLVDSKKVN